MKENVQEGIGMLQKIINTVIELVVNYSFQVVGALIILGIGVWIANWVSGMLSKLFEKRHLDITLSKFITGMIRILILGFALLIALGKFGITIAPFIAALSALTFGASFAIQGPLSNYGAGLSIILSRPFRVGDTITVAGQSGVVKEVKLACTLLTDEDGIQITIPNKHIVGEILHNSKQNKIVDAVVGVSYAGDPEAAVKVVRETLARMNDVVREPKPHVGIREFADSSINIGFRYWVPTAKYFETVYAVNLAVYKALSGAGITIPYPQRDIHIVSQASGIQS